MNKRTLRIAGWALGLSLALGGVGVAVGASQAAPNEPLVVKAAEDDTHDYSQSISQNLNNSASISGINIPNPGYPIKQIIITCNYNKTINPAVTISATVGGQSAGSNIDVGNKFSGTKTFDLSSEPLSGSVAISFTNRCGSGTQKGTFNVTNVRLVEAAVPQAEKPIGTIASVSLTSNSVPVNSKESIVATATFTPSDSDEAIKWATSDDKVATITPSDTENGVATISIVGVGTCHFTASNQDGSITRDSADFEVTEKAALPSVNIVKSSLAINDSSQSSTYNKYKGAQEADGLDLDVTAVMPNADNGVDVVQMQKTNGIIKNTGAFEFGIKMVKFDLGQSGGTPTVQFAATDTASSASETSVDVKLGSTRYFVPTNLVEDAQYFYIKQSSTDTGYYKTISILSETPAAQAFAEMYLDAYSCDSTGGSGTAIKSGYSYSDISTLYDALDEGVQEVLTNAVKNHTASFGDDKLKEFGQRYYLVVKNHGVANYDFMGLNGTVSFAASSAPFGQASNTSGTMALVISLIAVGTVGSAALVFLHHRHRKED